MQTDTADSPELLTSLEWRSHLPMNNAISTCSIAIGAILLCGCNPLDPLSVIENADGSTVLLDLLDKNNADRIICVRPDFSQSCKRSDADIVVAQVSKAGEVTVDWAPGRTDLVIVNIGSGKLERSPRTALNGEVNIEYR